MLTARLSGQWTQDNLDSSEKFSLGGAQGVRAYPTGEASGDLGWLGSLELRYALMAVQLGLAEAFACDLLLAHRVD